MKLRQILKNMTRDRRKECAEMLVEMATSVSFPDEAINALRDLDLSKASNSEIRALHKQLSSMTTEITPMQMATMFQEAEAMQN